MITPTDTYRLYLHLRDLAHRDDRASPRTARGARVVDLDREHESPNALGLSSEQVDHAIEVLMRTDLIHRLTPEEEQQRGIRHPAAHDMVAVKAIDDLTAATLLMAKT